MEVFLNGRRVVAEVLDLNIDEGWIEIEDLTALTDALDMAIKPEVDTFLPYSVELPRKRLRGKVTVKIDSEAL